MSLATFMLNSAFLQYKHHMNKIVKNKFKPVPNLVEVFNFNSKRALKDFGFPLYKCLIDEAWHPVTTYNNHKIVVWDIAYVFTDSPVTDSKGRFSLYICNKWEPTETNKIYFDTKEDRLAYVLECQIFFNSENQQILVKQPNMIDFKKCRKEMEGQAK